MLERPVTTTSHEFHASPESAERIYPRSLLNEVGLLDHHEKARIIFVDEKAFTRDCITRCLELCCSGISVFPYSSLNECIVDAAVQADICLILYHVHARPIVGDGIEQNLEALKQAFQGAPIVILSDIDRMDQIQEALARGARGYISTTSTTLQIAVEVIRLVRAGGTFIPADSLALRGIPREGEFAPRPAGQFTPRQMAVLHHLQQGKANKLIAHALEMSESTVKVHVRNIMKKMKATNRTEVAFRFRNLSLNARQE
jgi:DNA-binding NarL/FixJ family response regulator